MRQVLNEGVSFKNLLRGSEPGRIERGKHDVRAKSIRVASIDGTEAWLFSYKSNPSTTGERWKGYVRFLKEDVSNKDSIEDLDCKIYCNCFDYLYRYAYNNAKSGVGDNPNNINRAPRSRAAGGVGDYGSGACKHILSLSEFLKTKIEPDAPEPKDKPEEPIINPPQVSKRITPDTPPTINAPTPKDSYVDSDREGGYSDSRGGLEENKSLLLGKIDEFVKSNPEFDVTYE